MVSYSIYSEPLKVPNHRQVIINTINQYSYCMAENDPTFKLALQESDILLPDGISIVAAMRLLTGQKIKKIAGGDVHEHLLRELNGKGGRCFYLGSSEGTLMKIREKMVRDYPFIQVGTYSPPFKTEFSDVDNAQMLKEVNDFSPDVLFIGMTAPKQEKWAHEHRNQLDAQVICSIGAVFDFYAGTIERPDQVWIDYGLEWFVRLIHEPKRLWKRYLYYGPIFLWHIMRTKVTQKQESGIELPSIESVSSLQLQRDAEFNNAHVFNQ